MCMESVNSKLVKIRKNIDKSPTEGQKESGNYKMGHISINGFKITIENPKGSYRKGVDSNGKEWKTKMKNDYGYFNDSVGYDGDHVDVFLGSNFDSDKIFVIDQKKGNKFDESKVMLGFNTEKEAKNAYLSNYEKGWNGFHKITEVYIDDFKEWLYDGKKQRKPFYQYKENKKNTKKMKIKESVLRQLIQESINKVIVNEGKESTLLTNKLIKKLYRVAQGFKGVYHDDNWENAHELMDALSTVEGVSDFNFGGGRYHQVKDGGTYKEYNLEFSTEFGTKICGKLRCHLCGTMENPYSAYDMSIPSLYRVKEKPSMFESRVLKESRGLKSMKLYQIAKEHGGFNKDICFGKSFYLNDFTDDDVIGVVSEEELDALDGSIGDLNDYAIEKGYQVNKGDATQLLCMNDYTWVAVIERQSVGKYYDNSHIGKKKSLRDKNKTITDGSKDYPWSDHNKWFGSDRKREFDRRKENLQ